MQEAAQLIDQYDENGNGRLSYGEFCQLILPSTNDHLRAVAKSREAEYKYIKSAFLSRPVENALANLFQKEVEYQRAIDEIKRELNSRFDFTVKRCFDSVDKAFPYSTLDRNEIRDFVAEYYTVLSEDDLDAIIRRCDTDEDEQISEAEFKDVVKHVVVEPVATKFLSSIRRSEVTGSPMRSSYWRGLHETRLDRLRNSDITGSPSRTYNWRDFYDIHRDRDTIRNKSLWYDLSTARRTRAKYSSPQRYSWKDLSSKYRTYWRNGSYYRSTLYDADLDRRDLRYSFLDPLRRSRLSDLRRSSSVKKVVTSPTRMSKTVYQDTLSSAAKKVPAGRISQSSYNYARSSSPKAARRSTFRYNLYDGLSTRVRSRKSISPKRTKASKDYSPARKTLKTRFDVAEELVEETKTPVKEEKFSSSKKSVRTAHTLVASEQDDLVDSLRDLIDLDKELERAKESLALRSDFTLYDGFRVFDYDNNGYAELDDIIEAFEVFHIHPSREEARLFMTRFDLNKNNRLNYSEVTEVFTPLSESSSKILRHRSSEFPTGYYKRNDEFSAVTIEALRRVLRLHLEVEVNAEALRQKHEESPYFRYDDAFTTLNKWGDDYLTVEDFAEIFKKYGFYATKAELEILINRFDKDKDGKVSYDEFFEEFSPHSPLKV